MKLASIRGRLSHFCGIFLFGLCATWNPAPVSAQEKLTAMPREKPAFLAQIQPMLHLHPETAISLGIIRDGQIQTWHFGRETLDIPSPPNDDTLYEIGSITKVMTAYLLADSVARGKVQWDDPVQKHLPDSWKIPTRDGRSITLLQLATHTSSLPVQPPLIGLLALTTDKPDDPYSQFDESKLTQSLQAIRLDQPIGSKHDYSNLGYGLLGHALTNANKANTLEALLKERLFEPLGMRSTTIRLTPEQEKRFIPGHSKEGTQTDPWTFATLDGCGGVRSSVVDMLIFAKAAMARKQPFPVMEESWRELPERNDRKVSQALGWVRQKMFQKHLFLWHNGGTGGFRSFLGVVPNQGLAVCLLCNRAAGGEVDRAAIRILEELVTRQTGDTEPKKKDKGK